ncbi:MAG: site-2 protease family protein, partial [Kiritimatiellia bacterium]|nr:site-2 protease family protein [Kiritimatiellia bacterium]
ILGIFNLIPIPPLDGSRIVMGLLPDDLVPAYLRLESFGFILVFVLLYLGVLDYIISPIYHFLLGWLLSSG